MSDEQDHGGMRAGSRGRGDWRHGGRERRKGDYAGALIGNLIVIVSGERTPPATAQQPSPVRRRLPLGTLPAISFEVIEPSR